MWSLVLQHAIRKSFQNQKLQFLVTKRDQKLVWATFLNAGWKVNGILIYSFIWKTNHMFQSDVRVLTQFSNEIVWSAGLLPMIFWDIMYESEDIKKFVHVYDPYKVDFLSTGGQDFALIQIPLFKSSLPPNTFQVWVFFFWRETYCYKYVVFEDTKATPDGFSVIFQ